jgi:heme/copper-type cytochrome/quinol oxidase subunit 2
MRNFVIGVFTWLWTSPVFAQDAQPPAPAEVRGEPISSLMFFTLGIVLVIAIGSFVWFLRKRSNRAAADRVLNPNNPRNK